MNPNKSQAPGPPAPASLDTIAAMLATQALVFRATAYARRGKFDSAELVLSSVPRGSSEGLDLLARIRAQQGRIPEATALWTEALRLDPGKATYRDALNKAGQIHAAPWRRYSRPLLAVGSLGVLMVSLGLGAARFGAPRPSTVAIPPVKQQFPKAAQQLPQFSIPGVIQNGSGQTVLLRFESGLFGHGDVLTPEGRNILAAVGRYIEPNWKRLTLTVIGHTDDLSLRRRSRFQDNEALAIVRADVAIRTMSSATSIPRFAWSIGRKPPEEFLYQPDSMEGRLRNRTVEILISASASAP